MGSLIYGVGVDDSDYKTKRGKTVNGKFKIFWRCPYHTKWMSMLKRCYCKLHAERQPSYINCYVCEEWLTFSNFKKWMEQQDWEGKQLDKDLLIEGNKIYSPDTCVFVSSRVNNFILKGTKKGDTLQGSSYDKFNDKYKAQCSNPFTGKTENLGRYQTELEAHLVWKRRKYELLIRLLREEGLEDSCVSRALKARFAI